MILLYNITVVCMWHFLYVYYCGKLQMDCTAPAIVVSGAISNAHCILDMLLPLSATGLLCDGITSTRLSAIFCIQKHPRHCLTVLLHRITIWLHLIINTGCFIHTKHPLPPIMLTRLYRNNVVPRKMICRAVSLHSYSRKSWIDCLISLTGNVFTYRFLIDNGRFWR